MLLASALVMVGAMPGVAAQIAQRLNH